MNNKNTTPATIIATLAAGSTAAPYYYDVNITQKLCRKTCVFETPIFNPVFTVASVANPSGTQYLATIHVEGVISYVPCNCGSCNTKSQNLSQDFVIPFTSATAPTAVTLTPGTTINSIDQIACCNCSNTFVSDTPLLLNITA